MAVFLSVPWMEEVAAASPPVDPNVEIRVELHLLDGPDGNVSHVVELGGGRIRLRQHVNGQDPDVRIRLSYGVAVDLATGALSLHDAVLGGALKLQGDLSRLQSATSALGAIGEGLGTVQERTDYHR